MKGFPETFAIVDVETTGMRAGVARVMDIGIIRVENGVEVARYETLINPQMSIPSSIVAMTGIIEEDVMRAPTFDEVALEIQEHLQGAVFVAHSASFDYGFVKAEFARIGMEFAAETLCSVRLSRALYPKHKGHSLDKVSERLNLSVGVRHRALPDADLVWQFFRQASQTFSPEIIEGAVKYVRTGTASLVRDSFTELSDSAGVYMMYGPEQELLYVGKSKHVRTRARSHFHVSENSSELRLQTQAASISAISTSGELSALLLESSLIKSETPLFNRALRKNKELVIAKRLRDEFGYDRVSLMRTKELEPDGTVLSVFRSVAQGKSVLRTLAQEHVVCEVLLGIETSSGACFATQLGKCDGACTKQVLPTVHNERIAAAFKSRRIRTWPYGGPILITEVETPERGTLFFIDNWALMGAYRYDNEAYEKLFDDSGGFEYDTYKILARYLRKKENNRSVRVVNVKEFRAQLAKCRGEDEVVV